MNILFISHENALNGANKSMINLIDAMCNEHNFFVWCRQGNEGELIEELKKRKVGLICEPFYCWCTYKPRGLAGTLYRRLRWYLKEKPHNMRIVNNMASYVTENHIDLIHMNSSIIDIGVYLKKKYQIPLIWHLREFGKEDFGWIPLCTKKRFFKEINMYSDRVIAISKAVAKKYKGRIIKDKLDVVYNGIPFESQISDKIYDLQKDEVVFLQTGVLSEAKGQRIAVLAIKKLKEEGYNKAKIIFAGRGNPDDICTLEERETLNIEFLGQIKDMNSVRRNADVELVCSKCEAFGRVTVEAMMSGMPVIGSASGGTPELIKNGVTGFTFEPNSFESLADKMKLFLENPVLIKEMGTKAAVQSRRQFDIKNCAKCIRQVYKEVTDKRYGIH